MTRDSRTVVAEAASTRDAVATETSVLELLRRRSSEAGQEFCGQLAAHPDACLFHRYGALLALARLGSGSCSTGGAEVVPVGDSAADVDEAVS